MRTFDNIRQTLELHLADCGDVSTPNEAFSVVRDRLKAGDLLDRLGEDYFDQVVEWFGQVAGSHLPENQQALAMAGRCVVCGNHDIDQETMGIEEGGDLYLIAGACIHCGASWEERYRMRSVTMLVDPTDPKEVSP